MTSTPVPRGHRPARCPGRSLRARLLAGRREGGFTLIELLISITILGAISGAITTVFIVSMTSADRVQRRLPGPRGANNLSLYLASDVSSATPLDGSWLDVDPGADVGCASGPEQATVNVLRIDSRSPLSAADTYVASYRYEAPTVVGAKGRLWRVFCATGQTPSSNSVLVDGIDPADPPRAVVSDAQDSVELSFPVVSKRTVYPIRISAAVRSMSKVPAVVPGSPELLALKPPCVLTDSSVGVATKSTTGGAVLRSAVPVTFVTNQSSGGLCTSMVAKLQGMSGSDCVLKGDGDKWSGSCFGPETGLLFPDDTTSYKVLAFDRVDAGDEKAGLPPLDVEVAGGAASLTVQQVPGAPSGVTVRAGDKSLIVSWVAPVSTPTTPPVTGYRVTAQPGGFTCTSTTATTCTVTGLTNGTTYTITVTATNAAGTGAPSAPVTSKPVSPFTITGFVFEDVNYGGGAGRSYSSSGGRPGATVELYDVSGSTATYLSSTATDSTGAYNFASPGCTSCAVRVVGATVTSGRAGAIGSLIGVPTYTTSGSGGVLSALTDRVGGVNPGASDAGSGAAGGVFNTTSGAFTAGTTGTAQSFALVDSSLVTARNVDFGFNFDTVTNTNDSGAGSLRQVLSNANTLGGEASLAQTGRLAGTENVIFMLPNGTGGPGLRSAFNAFTGGIATISPTSALPTITSALTVNAQTQPGWSATPVVELNGTNAGAGSNGLTLNAGSSTVRGLVINRFGGSGVVIGAGNASTVAGSYIGTNAAGTAAAANAGNGVSVTAGSLHTVGGTGAADRNLISGNTTTGVFFNNAGGNVVGNYIGVNAPGAAAIANGRGVYVFNAGNVTVGGTATGAGNLISGNTAEGIFVWSGSPTVTQGNTIGLNATGSAALPNANGVVFQFHTGATIGGTTAAARNVISGNTGVGVKIISHGGHTVTGNYIGTNPAGTVAIPNGGGGVTITGSGTNTIGGAAAGAGNLISGNTGVGLSLGAPSNSVTGNIIGLNAAATAAVPNTSHGVAITAAGNIIGGTSTGSRNVIAGNSGAGIGITGVTSTANSVRGNSIYGNTGIGIDQGLNAVTGNDGTTSPTLPNSGMDYPVFTSASISGSSLKAAGYVGSVAGQTTFAGALVDVFASDNDPSGYGEGQTYLGTLTADANGNFTGTVTVPTGVTIGSTSLITGTATDASGNTSEFGPNFVLSSQTIRGTVFEDVNYGGGAGRSQAASGGVGVSGARVELYDSNGVFAQAVTSGTGGAYTFNGVVPGVYTVRVVDSSVQSSRTGSSATLVPVLTYRTEAPSGVAVAITDQVGGANPAGIDSISGGTGTQLWTSCGGEGGTCSFAGSKIVRYGMNATFVTRVLTGGTSCTNGVFGDPLVGTVKACWYLNGTYQSFSTVSVSSAVTGIDFGYSFDTVVNTNDTGQGSLRQAMTNANALGGDASLLVSGRTPAIEHVVFMLPNGTSAPGLRSTNNTFNAGVATVALASSLPSVSSPLVIDAQAQPGWSANPIVELNGTGAGGTGIALNGAGSIVRGLIINGFSGNGINVSAANTTIQGNFVGLSSSGSTASANGGYGVSVNNVAGTLIGGTSTGARNVISGNGGSGVYITGASATGTTIQGNYVGTSALGNAAVPNAPSNSATGGIQVVGGTSTVIGGVTTAARNVLSGNGGAGVWTDSGTGIVIQGNFIGTNANGDAALTNGRWGIVINTDGVQVGGPASGAGNLVSGNTTGAAGGIFLGANAAVVQGNVIGLNAGRSAFIPNGDGSAYGSGIDVRSGSGHLIGGVNAGEGNVIAGNAPYGIRVQSAATGAAKILGNSIYGNTGMGIDLGANGVTANDGVLSSGQPNQYIDAPVFTAAGPGSSSVVVSGYVGSAAGQTTFAGTRVEVFVSDNDATGFGEGQTYLGFLTADASGNFSGTIALPVGVTITPGTTKITGTATDGLGDTSEFGPNLVVTKAISGKVFEDVNYGGGAARDAATSITAGGTARSGARVELYGVSGTTATFLASTTTATNGTYSFAGGCTTCAVRVVGSTVSSARTGYTAGLLGVPTFMTDASGSTISALTNRIGGINPAATDGGNGANGATFDTGTGAFSAGATGTAQTFTVVSASVTNASAIDFGFNFDTIVNTNDSGAGSLRQWITNASTMGGESTLAQAGRSPAIESSIFQLPTTSAGYQSATAHWRISLASQLPTLTGSSNLLDGLTQAGSSAGDLWSGIPHTLKVEVNGNGLGIVLLPIGGSDNGARGLMLGTVSSYGVRFIGATRGSIKTSFIGLGPDGSTVLPVTGNGAVAADGASIDPTIGGPGSGDGNVIAGTATLGVWTEGGVSGLSVVGNFIGSNAAGTATRGGFTWGDINNISGAGTWRDIRRNILVGSQRGIAFDGDDNISGTVGGLFSIAGNNIGVGRDGVTALGNAVGIRIDGFPTGLTIGGLTAADRNIIAGNTGPGIAITNNNKVQIQQNSIWGNTGLGIDLLWNGVTTNDGVKSSGQPNSLMDHPVFTTSQMSGGGVSVAGYVGSAAGQTTFGGAKVDVYVSDNDSTGFGEGQIYLGSVTADASGNFVGTLSIPSGVSVVGGSTRITGTATDAAGNTSEFGANALVKGPPVSSGLVVSLDANDVASMYQASGGTSPVTATGQRVCRWSDQSGVANHALQSTTGQCPVYGTDGTGGFVNFTANGWYLTRPTLSPDATVLVVAQSNTTPNFNTWGWVASARGANGFIIHPWAGTPSWGNYVVDFSGTYTNVSNENPLPNFTTPHLYELTMAGSGTVTGVSGRDGVTSSYAVASVSRTAGVVNVYLGADDPTVAPGRLGDGRYREVLIYNRALSAAELTSVETYLRTKWGTG